MVLPRTVSKIKSDDCNILLARVFSAPPEGVPLEFCYDSGARKTRIMPLPDIEKKFDNNVKSFNMSLTDGQTNGRANFPYQEYRALHTLHGS